ncbi:MAG: sulfurtransferase [Candidatus Eremiobacteraeota bacterium]|nr:sulfurtransferase [Candidatus Eremiobacteraeota bacterium]
METAAPIRAIIGAAELREHLDDPKWVIVDCRHSLANYAYGREAFEKAHIPGAIFFDVETELSGEKTGRNGRHPLPAVERFVHTLEGAGISNDRMVVVYDDANLGFAARLWFLLRRLGHTQVAVLDGGWKAWTGAAYPTTNLNPRPAPAQFIAKIQPLVVDTEFVLAHHRSKQLRLLDARAADRYAGQNETIDPVGGHIPGAHNRFHQQNLDTDSGLMKSPPQLRAEFGEVLGELSPAQVIHYCGSGVTASLNLLAMEHAGLPGSRIYSGSWSEWCADPARPTAT